MKTKHKQKSKVQGIESAVPRTPVLWIENQNMLVTEVPPTGLVIRGGKLEHPIGIVKKLKAFQQEFSIRDGTAVVIGVGEDFDTMVNRLNWLNTYYTVSQVPKPPMTFVQWVKQRFSL